MLRSIHQLRKSNFKSVQRKIVSASKRAQQIQAPAIPIVMNLHRETEGSISLAQGVVGYLPPKSATDMMIPFILTKNHKYGPVDGFAELREDIQIKLEKTNRIHLTEKNRLCVTAGANMAFTNVVMSIADPGDEFILLTPYYFNHEMAIKMANCVPVPVKTDENYQPIVKDIAAAITPKTRAVVTVSPNNPTGAVYPEAVLREINALCKKNEIFHISDEPYENFLFGGAKHFSSACVRDSEDHTISLFSFSKTYALANWRVGYMVYPAILEDSVKKVQDTLVICPPEISQYVALGALNAEATYLDTKLEDMAEVRKIVFDNLSPLKSTCSIPTGNGAFYVFIRLPQLKTPMTSLELAKKLVTEHKVATIPGESFGMTDGVYLRLSYGALTPEDAKEGITRFVQGVQSFI